MQFLHVFWIISHSFVNVFRNLCRKDVISFQPQITLAANQSIAVRLAGSDNNRRRRIETNGRKIEKTPHSQTYSQPLVPHLNWTAHICMNQIRANRIINKSLVAGTASLEHFTFLILPCAELWFFISISMREVHQEYPPDEHIIRSPRSQSHQSAG